jgi:ubiquinone/menaquinone biosynthesis C-methylase UbiE
MSLNTMVRSYWEADACGTSEEIVGDLRENTHEWFTQIEEHRYRVEPFIHSVAQFTRSRGKKILEIGVGAGTDHLQWARAGAETYGVDLTDQAIETTRAHLKIHGLESNLQRIDAEVLPFEDETFDLVYSWGVIHHSEHPEKIIAEINRVLKPNGRFVGMLYARYSLSVIRLWIKYALLTGKPWRSLSNVLYHHQESIGTKAYTVRELQKLFREFSSVSAWKIITPHDTHRLPTWIAKYMPNAWGWFIALRVTK